MFYWTSPTKPAVCAAPPPKFFDSILPWSSSFEDEVSTIGPDFLGPIAFSNKPNIYAGVAATARDSLG